MLIMAPAISSGRVSGIGTFSFFSTPVRCYDKNLACGLGFSAGLAVRLLKQVKQAILNAMQRKLKALLMTIVISAAGSLESRNATEPEARNTP